jgi:hypothetical protein
MHEGGYQNKTRKSKGSGLFFYTFGLRNAGQSGSPDDIKEQIGVNPYIPSFSV